MRTLLAFAFGLLVTIAGSARADVGVEHSRLVYASDRPWVSMRVWNQGERSSLIQAWIDMGDPDAKPEALRAPLMVTPPLFRLPPGGNRDLIVRAVDAASLPADRESLLWLNVLDIPARVQSPDAGVEPEYAVRWRLKVFYRPASLVGTVEGAASSLVWRRAMDQQGNVRLQASNDSPFHVSLAGLSLGGVSLPLPPDRSVISPHATWSLDLPSNADREGELRIRWVNDQGTWEDRVAHLVL
ncbi:fimbrial chaperone [Stenotrophomonas sepilia]|uniref:Fimbrial chaperone n=1 Tax=Stenotrophomonas sepilia TaxID=2860290 RepID=A0ABQ6QH41_9GAMM|nr:fimbrial chaperone [Stenotrophomonas sepilia]